MKPWRRTSSRPRGDGKATSEVRAIIKFRATWWMRWERCPRPTGYLQCLDETGSPKRTDSEKSEQCPASREPIPLGGF
ncbi:MAG: hypothetical protein QOI53_2847 [Verrucomicrobiota bacterium]|nr:hypothetical protein [Verrucomicrobiota bacterium]